MSSFALLFFKKDLGDKGSKVNLSLKNYNF